MSLNIYKNSLFVKKKCLMSKKIPQKIQINRSSSASNNKSILPFWECNILFRCINESNYQRHKTIRITLNSENTNDSPHQDQELQQY